MKHFDLAVIGTGPSGQKAAIQAAKLGKEVVVIEKNEVVGGVATNTGTLPSKALREAVLHLTGVNKRGLYGQMSRVKSEITLSDLASVSHQVIRKEWEIIRDALERNNVELVWGKARFEDPHHLIIKHRGETTKISAEKFVIAVGTRPAMPENIPFDENYILTPDSFLKLENLPRSMIVVGGGVVGTEYACMMAALGLQVTLIEGKAELLEFLDDEITEALHYHMRKAGVTLRLGEKVKSIELIPADQPQDVRVQATLESGKKLRANTLLYSVGRQGLAKELGAETAGLEVDERGRLKANQHCQTSVEHIYATGDIIGFPALASTAMEQGQVAACHAFGMEYQSIPEFFPYGIYAIPEISMVGRTEKQLTEDGVPYESGVAQYREVARGQLLGDEIGMLKMLIHQGTHALLGVHIIGTGATELIHIGQAVMALAGTAEYFDRTVFNYPTLAEAYKIAALNGLNKLRYT